MNGGATLIGGAAAVVLGAALLTALLIVLLHPLLERYALARPNARSSHKIPTPQGGGIAVIAVTLAVSLAASWFWVPEHRLLPLALPFTATVLIALIGAADDIRPMGVLPRFLLQALAVAVVILSLPESLRVLPSLPFALERALLAIGVLWFVNLVNFMDGIDWMTVAEVVPVVAALAAAAFLGILPGQAGIVSLALGGAMLGFAFFNRPVAKLFLGDVGSLPIGLLLAWLLIFLAGNGGFAAAVLLPLYYLADATLTLLRRLARGEKVWVAHRSHFYQHATDRGFRVIDVVAYVFTTNIALALLAGVTLIAPSRSNAVIALAIGLVLVGFVLLRFERGR